MQEISELIWESFKQINSRISITFRYFPRLPSESKKPEAKTAPNNQINLGKKQEISELIWESKQISEKYKET